MRGRVLPLLAVLALVGMASPVWAMDWLLSFDRYVKARTATELCGKADPKDKTAKAFAANFELVANRARFQIEVKFPNRSLDEVTETLGRRSGLDSDQVHQWVDASGCSAPEVGELLEDYRNFAEAHPLAPSSSR